MDQKFYQHYHTKRYGAAYQNYNLEIAKPAF